MSNLDNHKVGESIGVTTLYNEQDEWDVNIGDKTIHAKRMPGKFRTIKNITEAIW